MKKERTVEAKYFVGTRAANGDNGKMTDHDFRQLVRTTLPIVIYEPGKLGLYGEPKEGGICEKEGCRRKATWDVCAVNGRSVLRCGRHDKDSGLTLDMRKFKTT